MGDSSQENIHTQPSIFHTINKEEQGRQVKSPSVVDVEPWDRIHRIQYTSFRKS